MEEWPGAKQQLSSQAAPQTRPDPLPPTCGITSGDAAGLFAAMPPAPRSPGQDITRTTAAAERRVKLYIYDQAACQALNQYGPSKFSDSPNLLTKLIF